MKDTDGVVALELSDDEVLMLNAGLTDWFGPGHATDAVPRLFGYADGVAMDTDHWRIAQAIRAGGALSIRDWTRALLSAEIIFVSEVIGDGSDWDAIYGGPDEDWMRVLRGLQQKIPHNHRTLNGGPFPVTDRP